MSMLPLLMGRTTVTETFTTTQSWTAPLTTNKITLLEGKGGWGTSPAYTLEYTYKVYDVDFIAGSGGSYTTPVMSWASLQSFVTDALAILNDPASPYSSLDKIDVVQYGSGGYNRTYGVHALPPGQSREPGTAYSQVFNNGSIPIDSDGTAYVTYKYLDSGAYGGASTAFGLSCPGGTPSVTAAPTTTFSNISVTPGATYTIHVPGGYIKIIYTK